MIIMFKWSYAYTWINFELCNQAWGNTKSSGLFIKKSWYEWMEEADMIHGSKYLELLIEYS